MPFDLKNTLVIGISSRALFDLEKENKIYEEQGLEEYMKYQVEHEDIPLEKGTAFHLIESLLKLNQTKKDRKLIEVVIMSRNSPDTGLRILNSIKHYDLSITRSAFTSSVSLANYIEAFDVDLFLSKSDSDIQDIIDSGKCAAALIYSPPTNFKPDNQVLRIAFDADAVIFSDASEYIYKKDGLKQFHENESKNEDIPLQEGPFAKFIKLLSKIQRGLDRNLIRIAIVTARDYPSNVRVIKTLRGWGVSVDEAFFLGGVSKDKVLEAFNAHIFFDDQDVHVAPASIIVPSSRVPYKKSSPLFEGSNSKENNNSKK
ncbi:5'-nucleotidase [Carboxylicivirga sp. A043]|uniref:5'-nucleotidase n=1 Tax=Carboxylicivirga litoralis TaxID=2816963 RepID=UPI0021CB6AD1|nr:5'-nucleotidase [Carboxylicivirga sp. A043]MCU4157456.1 5'-nucleotidase [Carboxylicivirga sp. A043]